ncbi:MAG: phycobilisome protein [Gomphosphaeria aponina SAG 52.96 = DSM 107014]|uniref:Phycobilisome protein n=1 Tax=Gomphosphaeria aponina SAG 52.96 = DSM 107014 TaxID=1521640 RepID=A0A941JM86_9CHRO|nr:phycobilisome protein [Gomphosphaeria aponina SAG 52.96 = DSM 107014]
MQPELEAFLYEAEERYLSQEEIQDFQAHIDRFKQRLATYENLREGEIAIFQPVADRLSEKFPTEKDDILEQALKHWLAVMRYSAMAMLLNNPEFLQRRLLEWLTPSIQAHQLETVEKKLYELLQKQLKELLPEEQLALMQPFLEQAKTNLLANALSGVGGQG